MSVKLHRLEVSGKINPSTPVCVIYEIAKCLNFDIDENNTDPAYINKIIRCIPNGEYITIDRKNLRQEDYSQISFFINPCQKPKWKNLETLINAFDHMLTFYEEKIDVPERGFFVGQKTNETPFAYNACMLYKICSHYGIRTIRSTTMNEMGHLVNSLHLNTKNLKHDLTEIISGLSHVELINLLICPELRVSPSPNIKREKEWMKEEEDKNFSMEDRKEKMNGEGVMKTYQFLTDPNNFLTRVNPVNQEEALVICAVVYGINLSECVNPYKQFTVLRSLSGSKNYIPIDDPPFRKRYLSNPGWFDIRKTWSPVFNCLFNTKSLQRFVYAEGYSEKDVCDRDPVELMHMSRLTPTFYLGRHPNCDLERTAIELEYIEEINPNSFVSYGISEGGPWALFKITALRDTFEVNKSYINPCNSLEIISSVSIKKLKNISIEKKESQDIPPSTRMEYESLLTVMKEVDLYMLSTSASAKELAEIHKNFPEQVELCLTDLLHSSYYMRGWKVGNNNNPPITREQTQFPYNLHPEVDINVTRAIAKFEESVNTSNTIVKNSFMKLPLMGIKKCGNTINFRPKSTNEEGKTIIGRIEIVKDGVTPHSCIRMSSNYLATSAYYYMNACKLPLPFDISLLANIS